MVFESNSNTMGLSATKTKRTRLIRVRPLFSVMFIELCALPLAVSQLETAGEMFKVTAVEGGRVDLPCDISTSERNERVALVLWFKDGDGDPLYSLDLRGRAPQQGRHVSGQALVGRAHFRVGQMLSQSSLQVEPVQGTDSGVYRCRVDYHRVPSRNQYVKLFVIEPPRAVVITQAGADVGNILQMKEGATLELTCSAIKGNPSPSVTWWRSSILVDAVYDETPEGSVRNTLLVPSLERSDARAEYTCRAFNNNVTGHVHKTVTLDLALKPLGVQIIPKQRPLSVHKTHEVKCQTYGSKPPPLVSWWKGSKPMRNAQENLSEDRSILTSVLQFVPTEEDHGKFLRCSAENPTIQGSAMEDRLMMDVHFPPTATLALGSSLKEESLKEGDDVYFECSIRANPRVYKVDWKFQGKLLHHNVSAGIIVSNQSLVLQKVKKTNVGSYTCVAHNTEGDGESNEVTLKLKHVPFCSPGQKSFYGAVMHEPTKITCDVEANPPPVHFNWALNKTKESLNPPRARISNEGSRSVAIYTPRAKSDYGTLLCWGNNEIGEQREPCTIILVPAGPPDPLSNCSIMNVTETEVFVACRAGFDGGLEQKFIIEVYDTKTKFMLHNATISTPVYCISGLQPGRDLNVVIYARNAKGDSDKYTLFSSTLGNAESRTAGGNTFVSTPLLALLCGGIGVVAFVVLITILLRKLRANSNKRMQKRSVDVDVVLQPQGILLGGLEKDRSLSEKDPDIIPGRKGQDENTGKKRGWKLRLWNKKNGPEIVEIPSHKQCVGNNSHFEEVITPFIELEPGNTRRDLPYRASSTPNRSSTDDPTTLQALLVIGERESVV